MTANYHPGLEGIVVARTRMSCIDGEHGRLWIAGRPVEALAEEASFEEVCERLWGEKNVRERLGAARVRAFERLDGRRFKDAMAALRASIAGLEDADAVEITAQVAVSLAAWSRVNQGASSVAPSADRGHAEDLLSMIRGGPQPEPLSRALSSYLVTVIDHGLNASTFTARVIASTRSDLVSSVVGGIGALKGPLHGGAPGPVLDMLDEIEDARQAPAWIDAALARGERIMGMGHRVYRARDPRAAALEAAATRLEQSGHGSARLALARAVERHAEAALSARYPERPLKANVEFFTAILLESIGVSREAFSGVFTASRVAGWCAHVKEQRKNGRLIRPSSEYVGA